MNASEFKSGLSEIKEQLRGITLQFVTEKSCRPFSTLRDFGKAVLDQEARGFGFNITQAWTKEGVKPISTFPELAQLLKAGKVTGVSFKTQYEASDFRDYLNNSFGTNV